MDTLIIGSNNPYKIQEIIALLDGVPLTVVGYKDVFVNEIDVVEDGITFEENAVKKVTVFPELESVIYLADDSGLSVEALGGRPGVYSARYAGEGASSEQLCYKLLKEMYGVGDRSAQFTCVVALRFPGNRIELVKGVVRGHISHEIYGENGFGYDPIFMPEDYDITFAEMSSEDKHALSHRGRALAQVRPLLQGLS